MGGQTANHNLRLPWTSFVGRLDELATIARLLREGRLVTLTGPGGTGKTRLAVQAALAQTAHFAGGVWLVELAALGQPGLVAETIAAAVALPGRPGVALADSLAAFLAPRHVLLVLDNCEHLVEECAPLAGDLLARCPDLTILATSREALRIGGEWVVQIAALALPAPGSRPTVADLQQSDAVRLFVDRVQALDRQFQLTADNADAVASICARVDGLPLALELAAARLPGMEARQLAARLAAGFAARSRLLPNRDRLSPPRQKTLQALLDWSYSLLTAPEQVLFRRLAVFAGSWSLEAAEHVCADPVAPDSGAVAGDLSSNDIADLLLQLANKSLLALHHADGRYHMLETIRLFARQKLDGAAEAGPLGRRHFVWYLDTAEEGAAHLNGPRQPEWLARLEQEHDNFRVALAGALATGLLADAALLALALWKFWNARIFQNEGLRWLEQILARSAHDPLPTPICARLYNALGVLAHSSGRFDEAAVFHEHALALWRSQGDPAGVAAALLGQGWQSFNAMKLDQARQYAGESLAVARGAGDRRAVAAALALFGLATVAAGRLDGVPDALAESLATWRAVDDPGNVASVLVIMAHVEQVRGDFEQAKPLVAEALRLQLQSGDTFSLVGSLVVLLDTALNAPNRLEGAGWTAQIAGVFATRDETIGGPPSPWATGETAARVATARARLGARRFATHFAAGRALTPAGLLALGEAITQPAPAARAHPAPAAAAPAPNIPALTGRELEVLRLVAAGLSNNEIATRLVVSRRTVEGHLRAIFSKLDVPSRSAAVRFAFEHGLGQ